MAGGKPIESLKQGRKEFYGLRNHLAFAFAAGVALLAPMAGIASEEAAEAAFWEAVEIVEKAKRADTLSGRWTYYETARVYMSQIRSSLSSTDLAYRLLDKFTMEGALYAETTRAVLETGKAVCEQDFTAVCVLRYARNTVLIVNGASSDNYLVEIALAQAAAGDFVGAFISIEPVHSITYRETFPKILKAMVKAGNLSGALTKAQAFQRSEDRDLAFLSINKALAGKLDVVNSRLVSAEIDGAADRAVALATVAGADRSPEGVVEREALFTEAVGMANDVANAEKRASLLFEIAALQLEVGEIGIARETIVLALAAAQDVHDIYDRSYMMRIALEQFEKAQHTEADQALVNELRSAMMRIDESRTPVEDFLDAAKSKFEAGDLAGAIAIMDQGRDKALASESKDDRDYFLIRIIADRSMMGDIHGALADWALMSDGAYESGWHEIAVAQAKVGDIDGIRKLLMADGTEIFNEPVLRYKIIPTLVQNGYFAYAHKLADTMDKDYFLHEEAMIEIAKGEASASNFDEALAAADSIAGRDTRSRAFSEIASAHLSAGMREEANRYLMIAFQTMFGPGGILSVKFSTYTRSLYDLNVSDWEAFNMIGQVLGEMEAGG